MARCLVLLTLLVLSSAALASMECQHIADTYLTNHHREPVPFTGDNMVFFLHMPRTAGRTFQTCLMKMATPPSKRCPKAYDHLRMNLSDPHCKMLSSHDDYSVVSLMPPGASVLSHLRDPVDRLLSAYEFGIEVSVRFALRPPTFRKRPNKVATEDVWPWSFIIPFFANDIKPRLARIRSQPQPPEGQWIRVKHSEGDPFYYNKVLNVSRYNLTEGEAAQVLPDLDPYDNDLVMSLRDFVHHPIAKELLHNGAAFQILGITNYSHWGDANPLRRCVWEHTGTMQHLLEVAKRRVRSFFHVGVTDKLFESVQAAVVELGLNMDSPAFATGDPEDAPNPLAARKAGGNASDVVAADIPELAKKVRETRLNLQANQKELFRLTQANAAESELAAVKSQVARIRMQLREQQESLMAARAKLPTFGEEARGDGMAEEAGRHLPRADLDSRKLPGPLGAEFQRCAQRAQAKNLQRRDQALAMLAMPDGRVITFSKEARKKIPQDIIEHIRNMNTMDSAIHALGTEILLERNEEYRKQGKLQELPKIPPVRALPKPRERIPKPERDEL